MKTKTSKFRPFSIAFMIMLMFAATFTGCTEKEAEVEEGPTQEEMMAAEKEKRDSLMMALEAVLEDIEQNISAVRVTEARMEAGYPDSDDMDDRKARIVQEIQTMNSLLAMDRETISTLEAKLRKSGVKNTRLNARLKELSASLEAQEQKINMLVATVEERDMSIEQLNGYLDNMSSELTAREGRIAYLNDSIEAQIDNMNIVYIAQGSTKELVAKGVVEKEGGIIGLGAEPQLRPNPSKDEFLELDKRKVKTIPVFAKKVEFVTPHPTSSYRVNEVDNEITSIEITNAEEFWKTSQYLVLATK